MTWRITGDASSPAAGISVHSLHLLTTSWQSSLFWIQTSSQNQAQEVQALYLKASHHNKQCDPFSRKAFWRVWRFEGWWSRNDPLHVANVTLARYACYTPPCNYKCLHGHRLMDGGAKRLLVIPWCAISEGQGTVRFLQARGKKQMKEVFLGAKTPSGFDSLCIQVVFFNETKGRYVSREETKEGQNIQHPANSCKGF